jgi:basic membrane protein A
MGGVFISYSSQDRARVALLAEALRAEGFEVWWDREIPVALTYDEYISQQLAAAAAVVVVWSPAAVSSQYVRWEAQEARQRGVLVPVLLEPARLPPEHFLVQAADLTSWTGEPNDREWRRLIAALARVTGREAAPALPGETEQVTAADVPGTAGGAAAAAEPPEKASVAATEEKPAAEGLLPTGPGPAKERRRRPPWYRRSAVLVPVGLAVGAAVAVPILLMSLTDGGGTDTTAAASTTAPVAATTEEEPPARICLVTDWGGVDDHGFNQIAWAGLQQAEEELGVEITYLESGDSADYAPNIQSFIDEGCDLIVTNGGALAADTAAAACAHPEQLFAILDDQPAFYPGSAWADGDGNPLCDFTNVRGVTFQIDEAAFLAGYLAAGVTRTGTVAAFGGMATVQVMLLLDGFALGVAHYNEVHGSSVQALGWDPASHVGIVVGNFTNEEDGRAQGESLSGQDADIILPVAGRVGLGTAAACLDLGCLVIGVDIDQYVSVGEYPTVWLTSILKRTDAAVLDTVINVLQGGRVGEEFVGTLANGGVDLAAYHDNWFRVSSGLDLELVHLREEIIEAGGLAAFLGG